MAKIYSSGFLIYSIVIMVCVYFPNAKTQSIYHSHEYYYNFEERISKLEDELIRLRREIESEYDKCGLIGPCREYDKCGLIGLCRENEDEYDKSGLIGLCLENEEPSVGDRCSSNVNCPDNAVCDRGTCVCSGTYLASGKVCHNLTNLALGKPVFGSSLYQSYKGEREYAVDGRTRVTDFNLLYHSNFELYPWLTVTLGRLSIVKSITIYNRIKGNGAWLHNVETRVGNSTDWAQMSTCGTFVGPGVTGGVHVIECKKLLYGVFVTLKIVKPNHITGDPNASGGKNCLVLEEVVILGILV